MVGSPVIAFVDTGELSYWTTTTNHAVVIVGLHGQDVSIIDPACSEGSQRIPQGEFELAWLNAGNACAIIKLTD